MNKPTYKLLDSKGRVLIPKEMRMAAGMGSGDILALEMQNGNVTVRKVEIVEVGDQSPEAVEAFVTLQRQCSIGTDLGQLQFFLIRQQLRL